MVFVRALCSWVRQLGTCFRFCDNFMVYLTILCIMALSSLLAYINTSRSFSTSCSKLAPDGTLTLGASHTLNNKNIQIIPFTSLQGKLSLFRLWGRERSKDEVTSLNCTEGDLLKWEADNWDTQICAPLPDSNLQCGEEVGGEEKKKKNHPLYY